MTISISRTSLCVVSYTVPDIKVFALVPIIFHTCIWEKSRYIQYTYNITVHIFTVHVPFLVFVEWCSCYINCREYIMHMEIDQCIFAFIQ